MMQQHQLHQQSQVYDLVGEEDLIRHHSNLNHKQILRQQRLQDKPNQIQVFDQLIHPPLNK